jgi:hypothetical protein
MHYFLVSVNRTLVSMWACFRSSANKDFFQIWKYVKKKQNKTRNYITNCNRRVQVPKCHVLKFVNLAGRAKTMPPFCSLRVCDAFSTKKVTL